MEKVSNLKIDSKKVYKYLNKKAKLSLLSSRLNNITFRVGRFIQSIGYRDEIKISEMYYDFNIANLLNKSLLLSIKKELLIKKDYHNLSIISEMLSIYYTNNYYIISTYSRHFFEMMNHDKYSSSETTNELMKVFTNNKYYQNHLK